MKLPEAFKAEINELLGDEATSFFEALCSSEPYRGIRLNTLKCDIETLKRSLPFEIKLAPFSELSYYLPEDKPGRLPAYHAGMFYSQEPSAACAVELLSPEKGEKVLDLCAAPGGKSTQIAAYLNGLGLLWSNEVVRARTNALLSNIERMGISNAVVSCCRPEILCERLENFFDKVLVDAPCSGEGMFRKDPRAVLEWSREHVLACAARQSALLETAARALKPGGEMVYSTCTFSREENENVITAFLEKNREFSVITPQTDFGRPAFGIEGVRIFPMDGGEGHFAVKLKKSSGAGEHKVSQCRLPEAEESREAKKLLSELFYSLPDGKIANHGGRLLLLPGGLPELSSLGVIRAGVELGSVRGGRIEPAHSLFMSQSAENMRQKIDFQPNDPALAAFLHGEEIDCGLQGYTAVCVNSVITGFGRASGGRLKNKYPKGLRIN